MTTLRELAKKLPVLPSVYRAARGAYARRRANAKSMEEVFTDIFKSNAWGGDVSVSGPGSDAHQTKVIAAALPPLFEDFRVRTMLDAPCGDFHWMKNVELGGVAYTGADIVREIVEKNRAEHAGRGARFECLNLVRDPLPEVDLIFCRDCLVHFSYEDIFSALRNICDSGSGYLLTTTFTDRPENWDIDTGSWRPLNLQAAPFLLPAPLRVINEECTEDGGVYADKSLALWRIEDIRAALERGPRGA
jgi:SAM-dependent methyltransferase